MYEGRTRGKKLKYTYSDDDDIFSGDDEPSARRSTRNAAPTEASTESRRPRFTASGRQIRSRAGGLYGEALLTGQRNGDDEFDEEDDEEEVTRPQRTRTSTHPNGYSGYDADDLEDASEVPSSANESGNEWQGVEDDLEHDVEGDDEEDEVSADESTSNEEPESLVVQLRYGKGDAPSNLEVQIQKSPPAKEVNIAGETAAAPSAQAPPKILHQSNSDAQQAPTMIATPHPFASIPQAPTHSAATVAAPSISSNGVDQI